MADIKALWKKQNFEDKVPEDLGAFRTLLETYSKIPPEEVDEHLLKIRDEAWAVAQFPCIGRFSFTHLGHFKAPEMRASIERLTAPGSTDALLDLGCCLGQTLRQLLALGVAPHQLYGSDLYPAFFRLGDELFRDAGSGVTFAAGDMLNDEDAGLACFDGRISLIHAAHFFHLFSRAGQLAIGRRIAGRFLQPGRADAVVFGRQIGSVEPGEKPRPMGLPGTLFLHNEASLQALWDEIGRETATAWRAEMVVLGPLPMEIPGFGADARLVRYALRQVLVR